MDKRQETGRQGEAIASQYLVDRGYKIIERNWRCSLGELDLILQKDDTLVFVEVRTRKGRRFGTAAESITPAKQARLIELAQAYLQATDGIEQQWRIDVAAVQLRAGQAQVKHIENAIGWQADQPNRWV